MSALACAWDICACSTRSAQDLAALIDARWRALVCFARERAPLYRDLYADVPARGPATLDALPWVSKRTVMRDLDRVVTDPRLRRAALDAFIADGDSAGRPFAGTFAVWTSSGTSGEPGIFIHDAAALAVYDSLQLFRFRGLRAWLDWKTGPMAGGRYALIAATGGHFAGEESVARLQGMYPWLAQRMRSFSLMQPASALMAQLDAYQPDILATYPTVAAMLVREQQQGRLHIRPSQIWTGAECQTPAIRRQLQEVFGAQVRDEYGASEFPSIAADCAQGYLHVNADWVVLEPVDENYRPVAPGTASHSVLLTNLANRAQPLIRYDLGDSITMGDGPCACGNPLPAMRLHGRDDDTLQMTARNGAVVPLMPLALITVLEEGGGVSDFQLEQIGPAALGLRLGEGAQALAARAVQVLQTYLVCQGLDDVDIAVLAQPPRRGGAGGKLRRIVRRPVPRASAGDPAADSRGTGGERRD